MGGLIYTPPQQVLEVEGICSIYAVKKIIRIL